MSPESHEDAVEHITDKTVYISGPMTGIPEHNLPAFNERAKAWRDAGWFVRNPAEEAEKYTVERRSEFLKNDIRSILDSDAIAILPGWQKSEGALMEVHIARTLGMPVYDAHTFKEHVPETDDRSILIKADEIINGPRNEAYGDPRPNHERIAGLWSVILERKVTWVQVILCMVAVKVARLIQTPSHEDSWMDIAGYAALVDKQARTDREGA